MHAQRPSNIHYFTPMTGLLCSTALTLSLAMTLAGPALGQDNLVYERNSGANGNDWDVDGETNWRVDGSGPDVVFNNDDAVTFENSNNDYTVDITEDVAPGSIFFEQDTDDLRTLNGAGGNLSTNSPGSLQFDVEAGFVELDVDVSGDNRIIFNDNGASGVVSLVEGREITADIDTRGGDLNNFGVFGAVAAPIQLRVQGGVVSNQITGTEIGGVTYTGNGVINGTVRVTGGELNNEGGTVNRAEITGDVTIDDLGVVNADGGIFNSIDVQGGELFVRDATDGNVTVSGGVADMNDILTGTLDVTDGVVVLDEDDNLPTEGTVTGQTTVAGADASINNYGTLNALTITDGTVSNQTTGAEVEDGSVLDGNTYVGNGTINGPVNISGGELNNEGNATDRADITGDVTITGTGVVNADGGNFGDIDVQGGELFVRDETDADVTVSGGVADMNDILTGTLDVTSGTVDLVVDVPNSTEGTVTGLTDVSGGTVNNLGTLNALDMTGGTVNNDFDGTHDGAINGLVNVTGGILNNSTGADIAGAVVIGEETGGTPSMGVVNATGGTFDTVDVQEGGTLNMTAATDMALTVSGGDANIDNTLTGSLEVTGGTAQIEASGVFAGTAEVSGGQILNAGSLTSIEITDGDVTNQLGGSITGTVDVTGGSIGVNAGSNIAGTVNVSANGTVNLNGGTFTNLNLNGGGLNINVETTGDIVNDGTNIGINADVAGVDPVPDEDGRVIGTIDNVDGTLTTEAGASVTGLVTNRSDGVIVSNGGTFESGILVEDGTVTIAGDTTMGAGSTLTNQDGTVTLDGDLTGNLANVSTGQTTNNATLDGNLTIEEGRFIQNGAVGSTGVTGTVSVEIGTLEMAGGTFDQLVSVNDGGIVVVTGTTAANVANNMDGDITIEDGGAMTGTLTSDGAFEIAGTLDGALTVNDGTGTITGTVEEAVTLDGGTTTVSDADAQINGLTTVNAANLDAEAGDFAGGVRLNTDADMDVTGAVSGDVENVDGDLTIASAGNLTGTVDQTDGETTVRGTLTGNADVENGTFTLTNGTITGDVDVQGGDFDSAGGTITNGLDMNGGTASLSGTLITDLTITGGDTANQNDGIIQGDVVVDDTGLFSSAGQITGTLDVDGGEVTQQAGGSVDGATTVTGGILRANGGAFAGDINTTGGDVVINGNVDVTNIAVDGGTLAITTTGDITGGVTHTGGTSDIAGAIASLDVDGAGLTTQSGATVSGATNITSGTMDAEGGTFTGGITIDGGRLDVEGPVTADVTNTDGSLIINAPGTLTGDVTNADNMRVAGTMVGDLTNTGEVDARGTITGAVNNDAGTFTVADTLSATVTDTLTNALDATLDLEGTLIADVTNEAGGVFNIDSGTLTGGFTNFGDITSTGVSVVSGASRNEGDITVTEGSLTVNDTFTNVSGDTLTIDAGTTFAGDPTVNETTGRIVNNGTLLGAVQNAGVIDAANGLFSGGVVTNSGTINAPTSFAGGLSNTGTIDLTQNGTTGDVVSIGGTGLSGTGTFLLDLDLSGDVGESDYVLATAGAPVTGTVELSFNVLGLGGQQDSNVLVLDVDDGAANNFNITTTNLPDPGDAIIYVLIQDENNGDAFIADLLNPGIGALAGSIVLTQSLIGSVINRPSSPFVTGLAYADEDACGPGGWARFTGGSADSNGMITQEGTDVQPLQGEISADFYGLQVGGDFACSNGYFNGWDLTGGGIAGFNQGQSSQPVFALNTTGESSNRVTSVTDVDFFQSYAGVYGTASKDRFVAELQYRVEQTDFTANNEGRNGSAGLGLNDSDFGSDSSTISGSVSYALSVPNTELTFVPVAGFAYTQVSTDPIIFDPDTTVDGDESTVQVQDFEQRIGFIGGTLSRTKFGEDGTTAMNQFVTATYYNDFASDPTSLFTSSDGTDTRTVTTENLGAYTELSAGVNYVQILDVGNKLNAKQLSASARADLRISDQLESWGVTAQVRIQF